MNAALPRWVSRLAALALLIAVLGAVYLYGVMPLFAAYRDIDAEIEGAEELLAGFERIAARRQTYEDQLETLGRRQTGVGIYLSGTTNALAAADLQDRVKDAVEANGGQLRSIQILPEKADGAFTRVSVRVQLTANMAGFHRILYSLESGKPFIFVDNLDVRNRRARRRAALQDVDPVLTVRFDLLGYLRPGVG
jgi:general secretion pathway protein M